MSKKVFQWAVIGAGPAGIAAVGKLLDNHVPPQSILWIDPHFAVGDLGQLWRNVSSNTKAKLFTNFLQEVVSFQYQTKASSFTLSQLDPEKTCTLKHVVAPLQWISDKLCHQVKAKKTTVHQLCLSSQHWAITTEDGLYTAQKVILAQGALPCSLAYSAVNSIPFPIAMDKEKLTKIINPNETYAVFGSSHSAIIILRYLTELGVKRIINFYRSPCRYAVELESGMLFDNTGLKGDTALWARKYIDGVWPDTLERYYLTPANISLYLPQCNKVIYAVGFERRKNILINHDEEASYDPQVGIIAPGLFGLGIAYPELKNDAFGQAEFQVGLWKFMLYLNKVLPIWFSYPPVFKTSDSPN